MASRIVQYFADKLKTIKEYPITLMKCIYDDDNNRLDNVLGEMNKKQYIFEYTRTERYSIDPYENKDVYIPIPTKEGYRPIFAYAQQSGSWYVSILSVLHHTSINQFSITVYNAFSQRIEDIQSIIVIQYEKI